MSNTKFTKGPWKTGDIQEGEVTPENDLIDKKGWKYKSCLILSGSTILADVKALQTYNFLHDFDQFQANAKLIAASPELLEALIAITSFIDKEGPASKEWEAITECNEKAKAVIKKATE